MESDLHVEIWFWRHINESINYFVGICSTDLEIATELYEHWVRK